MLFRGRNPSHFLLRCPIQQPVRDSRLPEKVQELSELGIKYDRLTVNQKIKTLVDCSILVYDTMRIARQTLTIETLNKLEELCRRYMYVFLHSNRFRALAALPKRKGKRARAHHKSINQT